MRGATNGDRNPHSVGVTYDSGALLAAERNDRRMWALHAGFLALGVTPVVPAPVLAQVWRGGGRQANIARVLAMTKVEAMTTDLAKAIGILAGRSGHYDVVDVAVVEGALRRGDSVVTADSEHLRAIADAVGVRLRVERV